MNTYDMYLLLFSPFQMHYAFFFTPFISKSKLYDSVFSEEWNRIQFFAPSQLSCISIS